MTEKKIPGMPVPWPEPKKPNRPEKYNPTLTFTHYENLAMHTLASLNTFFMEKGIDPNHVKFWSDGYYDEYEGMVTRAQAQWDETKALPNEDYDIDMQQYELELKLYEEELRLYPERKAQYEKEYKEFMKRYYAEKLKELE